MSSFKTIKKKKKKTILQRLPTYDTRRYNIYQFFLINIINDKREAIKKLECIGYFCLLDFYCCYFLTFHTHTIIDNSIYRR